MKKIKKWFNVSRIKTELTEYYPELHPESLLIIFENDFKSR